VIDHARFGELSLPDGPIGRTREYRFPPYTLPGVAGRSKLRQDDKAHLKKHKAFTK
jgi:hypothetical protein